MAEDNSNRPKSGLAKMFDTKKKYVFINDSLPPTIIIINSTNLIDAHDELVKVCKHPADFVLAEHANIFYTR